MARIYYRWTDEEGEERITRKLPEEITNMWGGTYVPDYEQVVVIPVVQDND